MVRIYLDWNVYSQMKMGYWSDLYNLIKSRKGDLFLPYSTTHIDDINKNINGSISDEIYSDLEFLSELTSNQFMYINSSNKLIIEERDPKGLLEDRLEEEKYFNKDLSDIMIQIGKDMEEYIPNASILFDKMMQMKFDTPPVNFQNIFPDGDSCSFSQLLDSFYNFYRNLNSTENFKDLRKTVQNGLPINRDRIFNTDDPIKMIESAFEKMGVSYDEFKENIRKALKKDKNWFNEIVSQYINLDMFGYNEDIIKVNKKKSSTFKNTLNDSFHTAFGSTCHFFIINDKRAFEKANVTYNQLGINSHVLKPEDCAEHINSFACNNTFNDMIKDMTEELGSNEPEKVTFNDNTEEMHMLRFKKYFLCFFNKVYLPLSYEENKYVILSTDKPTNGRFNLFVELSNLISKIDAMLNVPGENRIPFSGDEFDLLKANQDWERNYLCKNIIAKVTHRNGFVQLYLFFV